ncbi:hypothetical protein TTHERM_000263359 (macronuclear) [Tetrahymena thermophila SB210]|uniref:Transmembrane protein n=1 Tax=Tetrahymena thermophila (strain SB210) TaxID=312017 RepID=W7XEI2_TETTS|nr:hypothetical protein TTHERM_000263359 [Tetrahymena thermophila SB210]EWS76112.1 hypothetical protein TTHERM_000263359 [Tetrahymena thermophila SB210]|eukprot:XP_012651352.1 hypothetical protein TTHERM_000263359 [Tetrahymena thermophila SB210]
MINQQGIMCNFILLLIIDLKGMVNNYHLKLNKNYYGNLCKYYQKKMISFMGKESMMIIIDQIVFCQMYFMGTDSKQEQSHQFFSTHIIHSRSNYLSYIFKRLSSIKIKTQSLLYSF